MRSPRSFFALLLAFSMIPAAGCQKKRMVQDDDDDEIDGGTKGKKVTDPDVKTPKKDSQEAIDLALGKKLDLYIVECRNTFSHTLHDSENRYFSWVDYKKGLTGKERIVYGLYKVNLDAEKCKKAAKEAKTIDAPNTDTLDKAGDAYQKALLAAVSIINKANDYYDGKDYKDDDFKKGKDLHPKLVAAWDDFDKADTDLMNAIDELQGDLEKRELARIEKKEGKKESWHVKNTIIVAKAFRKTIKPVDKLEADKVADKLEKLKDAVTAFSDYCDGDKKAASDASSYLPALKELVKQGKELARRLKTKTPFDAYEKEKLGTSSGWMVEGSPDSIWRKYGDVVDTFNRLHF